MNIRTSLQTLVSRTLAATQRQTSLLAELQQQAATGKRIQTASDDPALAGILLTAGAQDQRYTAEIANVQSVRATLDAETSNLQDAAGLLAQARTAALDAANSGNDQTALDAAAHQVDQLLGRLVDLANSRQNGVYLFAGDASQTPPFTVVRDAAGRITQVAYQGGSGPTPAVLTDTQTVDSLMVGRDVFQQTQRGATTFGGTTGAQPGSGVDSATGQGTLQVRHTATTYAAVAGVQPGAGSAAGDTVLGPAGAHQIQLDAVAGTVALDGGPPVAFTAADTNLRVEGPGGNIVYLDLSAVTAGFQGSVAIAADGTLSTDGGLTTTPITFAANQQIVDSRTGAVTNVNSTSVRQAGDAAVEYPGTYDAFQALIALRDDLLNTRGLSAHDQIEAVSGRVAELDRVRTHVLDAVGRRSTDLQNLDAIESHLQDLQLTTRKLLTDRGGADLSEVVIRMQSEQNLLQLSLAGFARILDQNLLDYLQ
jgi:flagellin-like hook-associated protein FlgL